MTKIGQYQRYAYALGAIFITAAIGTPAAQAQRLTCNHDTVTLSPGCIPVYFFPAGDPVGGVTLGNGTNPPLYGTTNGEGAEDGGSVYELTPPAKAGGLWSYTLLANGGNPNGPVVIDKNGALYGMTTGSCGTIYQLTPPAAPGGAWAYNTLYTFAGGNDGCQPWWAGLVLDETTGIFYGTTAYGGSSGNGGYGWGTVFQLAPPAVPGGVWTESVLYSFTGGNDGAYPQASLLIGTKGGVAGNPLAELYGTAYSGGIAKCGATFTEGCGTVFELKPQAGGKWKESTLYRFKGGNDGGLSSAALVIKGGVLYGTTSQEDSYYDNGGDCTWGCGTVFELAPPVAPAVTWTETVLYHFLAPYAPPYYTCPTEQCDASVPVGGVVFGPNGALYGTTAFGGAFSTGTIFEIAPPASPGGAWTETVLYDASFYAPTGGYTSFPQSPFASLTVGKKGILYGTSTGDAGMVFELKP